MTLNEVANRLAALGHPLPISALSKIETAQRRLDVDDLVALSLAMDVPPNRLLFPGEGVRPDEEIQLTPNADEGQRTARDLWLWASGDIPAQLVSPGKINFFLSAGDAKKANEWAGWISWHLRVAGYTTFWPKNDVRMGDDIIAVIEGALRQSEIILVLFTEDFVRSQWAELQVAHIRSRLAEADVRMVPVIIDNVELPDWALFRHFIDLQDLDEQQAIERLHLLHGLLPSSRPHDGTPPPFPRDSSSSD